MNIQTLRQAVYAQLDQLNPRERKLVGYCAAVVLLTITGLVLIEPAWRTLEHGPANQSALVSKAAQVMRAADELEALRSVRSRVQVKESDIQARLTQLLTETGIEQHAKLQRTEDGVLHVHFDSVSASAFLAWLAKTQAIASLRILRMEMEKISAVLLKGQVALQIQTGST